MSVDFNREVDRRSTSDVKWRPEGLKGYLPGAISHHLYFYDRPHVDRRHGFCMPGVHRKSHQRKSR